MQKNYEKSDIYTPQNRFETKKKPVGLNSKLTEFQRVCYNMQLAEHRLDPQNKKFRIWVKDLSEYEKEQENFEDLIQYLLDDNVSFQFLKDSDSTPGQTRFQDFSFEYLTLFSGGLDSMSLPFTSNFKNKQGVVHHTITHKIPYGKSLKIFNEFLKPSGLTTLITSIGKNRVRNPAYLKTRGLVFLTNALCIASQLEIPSVVIPENGPFMINLPISPNADPTRTADPLMIQDWTQIFNKITNSNVKSITPFLEKTKSEVIISHNVKEILPKTWSCSYFQGLTKMCGMCNSCLVRILSCYAIEEGETMNIFYKTNPFTVNSSKLKENNLYSYRISLDAIDFWYSVINPNSLSEINRQRYFGINDEYPIMLRHALDMFLGFRNFSKKYSSNQPLFLKFSRMLKYIDKKILDDRSEDLTKLKQKVGRS